MIATCPTCGTTAEIFVRSLDDLVCKTCRDGGVLSSHPSSDKPSRRGFPTRLRLGKGGGRSHRPIAAPRPSLRRVP